MQAPPQQAGGFSRADDVEDEMLRLLAGVEDALLAPPEAQLRCAGRFSAANLGLKNQWFGQSLQDATAAQPLYNVADAGACTRLTPVAAVGRSLS